MGLTLTHTHIHQNGWRTGYSSSSTSACACALHILASVYIICGFSRMFICACVSVEVASLRLCAVERRRHRFDSSRMPAIDVVTQEIRKKRTITIRILRLVFKQTSINVWVECVGLSICIRACDEQDHAPMYNIIPMWKTEFRSFVRLRWIIDDFSCPW